MFHNVFPRCCNIQIMHLFKSNARKVPRPTIKAMRSMQIRNLYNISINEVYFRTNTILTAYAKIIVSMCTTSTLLSLGRLCINMYKLIIITLEFLFIVLLFLLFTAHNAHCNKCLTIQITEIYRLLSPSCHLFPIRN